MMSSENVAAANERDGCEMTSTLQTINVAGIQFTPVTGDIDANLAAIASLARQAKAEHEEIELLAVPELALSGYNAGTDFFDLAVSWPNDSAIERLSELAQDLHTVIVAGYPERSPAFGRIYDSAAIIDADGTPLKSYRKTHCLDTERHFFTNGAELPIVQTLAGTIGVMICWDGAMPEVARTYALQGADYLVMIGAWEDPYVEDWELVVSARAYDNCIPVLAVNRTGIDGGSSFSGHSRIVDCLGKTTAQARNEENAVVAGLIDLTHMRAVRKGYGSQLRDRRPELYGALAHND